MPRPVIAIDGPAGSGKSTLARSLAAELDMPYINTGLMYRALALRALRSGIAPDDAEALGRLARDIDFELDESMRPPELSIDGRPPEPELTSPEVELTVSRRCRLTLRFVECFVPNSGGSRQGSGDGGSRHRVGGRPRGSSQAVPPRSPHPTCGSPGG